MNLTGDELRAIKDMTINKHSVHKWQSQCPDFTPTEKKNHLDKAEFYLKLYNKLLGAR